MSRPGVGNAARLAVSLLSVARVGQPRVDRAAVRGALLLAPVVGALLGVLAAAAALAARALGLPDLAAGVLGIGVLAAGSGGLHLDGLADLADGLGSRGTAERALEVMRRSDIGPSGVVALVLVLLLQGSAVGGLVASGGVLVGLPVAAATGRCSVTLACRRGVPAARPDGLGRLVAGTVPPVGAALVAVLLVAASAVLAHAAVGWGGSAWSAVRAGGAVLAGLGAGLLLERHARRRLGGVTGDVLGALVETATTVALLVLAAAPPGG